MILFSGLKPLRSFLFLMCQKKKNHSTYKFHICPQKNQASLVEKITFFVSIIWYEAFQSSSPALYPLVFNAKLMLETKDIQISQLEIFLAHCKIGPKSGGTSGLSRGKIRWPNYHKNLIPCLSNSGNKAVKDIKVLVHHYFF